MDRILYGLASGDACPRHPASILGWCGGDECNGRLICQDGPEPHHMDTR